MGSLALAIALLLPFEARGAEEPSYEETRELMQLVSDAVRLVEEEGLAAACEQFRVRDSKWFEGDDYVFVLDMAGETICHPAKPSLEGKNLLEMRDPKGKPIVAGFVKELETADQGWVHYQWPRPSGGIFYWKTSHVRRARTPEGREVIVGSGRYQMRMERFFVRDQVEDAVALMRELGPDAAYDQFRDRSKGFLFYNAYVFVIGDDGVLRVNNAFPENEGRNVLGLVDIDGKYFVREMLQVPVGEARWIHYKWPRPGDIRPSAKSSYVRRVDIDGERLLVGAGVYFEREPDVRVLGPAPDAEGDG